MNLPTLRPLNKVTAGALAGAITVVIAWLLRQFVGIDLPDEVEAALAVIIAQIVAYLTPLSADEADIIAQERCRQ